MGVCTLGPGPIGLQSPLFLVNSGFFDGLFQGFTGFSPDFLGSTGILQGPGGYINVVYTWALELPALGRPFQGVQVYTILVHEPSKLQEAAPSDFSPGLPDSNRSCWTAEEKLTV